MRKDKRFAKKLLFAVLAVVILVSIAVMGIGNASALADTKRVYFTSNGYWDKFFAVYAMTLVLLQSLLTMIMSLNFDM